MSDNSSMVPIYETVLPANVILSAAEIHELCDLEQVFKKIYKMFGMKSSDFAPYVQELDRFDVDTTTNAGIHYFCIEKKAGLVDLVSNRNISPDVALGILEKSKNDFISRRKLLHNSVVFNNLPVFKKVFIEGEPSVLVALITYAPYMHVSTLLFLLSFVAKNESMYMHKAYSGIADQRSEEIIEWMNEVMPESEDLPLSWILRLHGFNQ